MEVSLPGAVGALIGFGIGMVDYRLVALLVRRALDRTGGGGVVDRGRAARLDLILKVVFVVNCLVFAGLGYWFGATLGG